MKRIFFIRHGETEHNVAQLLAGITDSRLTNHGVLQTQRLGTHFTSKGLRFTHIFASDLQRASMTAQAVADAQFQKYEGRRLEVVRLPYLREQDFGSDELVPWNSKRGQDSFFNRTTDASGPNYKPKESVEVMKKRATTFLDDFIIPLLATAEEETIAVVSHGLFLGVLWRDLLARFRPESVVVSANAVGNNHGANFSPLEHIGIWANTAYLEVDIQRGSTLNATSVMQKCEESESSNSKARLRALSGWTMVIKTVNGQEHIQGLKKSRGGLGSLPHDPKQKDIAWFFKKPMAEHENAVESGELLERALDTEIEAEQGKVGSPMGGWLR